MRRFKSAQSYQDMQAIRGNDHHMQNVAPSYDDQESSVLVVPYSDQKQRHDLESEQFDSILEACQYVEMNKDEYLSQGVTEIIYRDAVTNEYIVAPRECFDYADWYQEMSYLGSGQQEDEIMHSLRNPIVSETNTGFNVKF